MAKIYIAFVDTPGFFAGIIRSVLKQKYVHVVLALDENLREAYSIGRRHPAIPFLAGFEREDKKKVLRAFPGADYMVCSMECTAKQQNYIETELRFILSLCGDRTAFYFDELAFLSEKSLHLFLLSGQAFEGGRCL